VRLINLSGMLLGVLVALLVLPMLAAALPDISISLGGSYPIHLQGTVSEAATSLATASGDVLEGTGATLLLLTTELSSLGHFTATFTNMKDPATKEKCHSTGDATGVVLASGEFHTVSNQGGVPELLFLLTEFEIECAGLEVLVRGTMLATLDAGEAEEEATEINTILEGEKGKENLTEYVNDGGTAVTAKLESEQGTGFTATDADIEGEFSLEALEGKMLTVSGLELALNTRLRFKTTGQVRELFSTQKLKVKGVALRNRRGTGKFKLNENCLPMEMPPCRMKVEFQGPEVATLTNLTIEFELNGRIYKQVIDLVR
jgi:hypothetical protein